MRRSTAVGAAILACTALAAGAALLHLGSGQRYKLYLEPAAARCWAAVQEITFAPSATRFRRLEGPHQLADGGTEATIEFESRNLFAGSVLSTATCRFDPRDATEGRRAASIVVNGQALDAEILEAVNEAIDPPR